MVRLIVGLLLSFMICYLEWGARSAPQSAFVFQIAWDLLTKRSGGSFGHPAVFLPLSGMLLLLFALLQRRPSRGLIIAGIALMSLLVLLILAGGMLTKNVKVLISVVPYWVIAVLLIRRMKRPALPG